VIPHTCPHENTFDIHLSGRRRWRPHRSRACRHPLENPYVFDSVARDLKAMEGEGLLRIVDEQCRQGGSEAPIDRLSFVRLR
jgi:hypothetical protein